MTGRIMCIIMAIVMGINNSGNAQQENAHTVLGGSTIPDLAIVVHSGNTEKTAHLADYKGKVLLIDFWDVNCLTCLESMPHMLSLQREFGGRLQVLLVTRNSDLEIQTLIKQMSQHLPENIFKAYHELASVESDTVINDLFPHAQNPIHVWITADQRYYATAYANSTNERNINLFLNNEKPNLDRYAMPTVKFDQISHWIDQRFSVFGKPLSAFLLTGFDSTIKRMPIAISKKDSKTDRVTTIACFNQSIAELYEAANKDNEDHPSDTFFAPNHPLFDVSRNNLVAPNSTNPSYIEWVRRNSYCYAMQVSPELSERIYNMMRNNLDQFFGFSSKVEVRNVECLILKKVSSSDSLRTLGGDAVETYKSVGNGQTYVLRNMPLSKLFYSIYTAYVHPQPSSPPFINETNYTEKIDIDVPWVVLGSIGSIPSLRHSLQKYGLDLVTEFRPVSVLVVKENRNF